MPAKQQDGAHRQDIQEDDAGELLAEHYVGERHPVEVEGVVVVGGAVAHLSTIRHQEAMKQDVPRVALICEGVVTREEIHRRSAKRDHFQANVQPEEGH